MKTKVSKWGNSLALRLPKAIVDGHNISEGADMELVEREDGLLLTPVPQGHDLESLLAQINEENLHSEISTGRSLGKEVW